MKQYIDIVKHVLSEGEWKENRTSVRCLTTFCEIFRHNMKEGFPLLTTKKIPLRIVAGELEFFIKGLTSKKWLQDRNIHIWDEWANPYGIFGNTTYVKDWPSSMMINWNAPVDKEEEKKCGYTFDEWIKKEEKRAQRECDDLGPLGYSWQLRKFNQAYSEDDTGWRKGEENNADQLKTVVHTLKTNPNDRRMLVSHWNPLQNHKMALMPCHVLWNVQHVNGKLNLVWFQRSCDLGLGVPFNIASYALLLFLLCKESGFKPGELVGVLSDCHIYENQLENIKRQIEREPYPLPRVEIPSEKWTNIFDWIHSDFILSNYQNHGKLKLGDVAV